VDKKKPVQRAIYLEEAVSELLEAEYILSKVESSDLFQAFTTRQKAEYYNVLRRVRTMIKNLSDDASREQSAA